MHSRLARLLHISSVKLNPPRIYLAETLDQFSGNLFILDRTKTIAHNFGGWFQIQVTSFEIPCPLDICFKAKLNNLEKRLHQRGRLSSDICENRELTLKCKLKCYEKPMKDPLGVSPSKGNQVTTRGKEKFLLTSVGIEPTTSGLDLPLLCRLSYEAGQRK